MAEGEKIKVLQRHAVLGGGFLVCDVAFYDWGFAPWVLEGGSGYCDLAVLHRGEGEWVGALADFALCPGVICSTVILGAACF